MMAHLQNKQTQGLSPKLDTLTGLGICILMKTWSGAELIVWRNERGNIAKKVLTSLIILATQQQMFNVKATRIISKIVPQ